MTVATLTKSEAAILRYLNDQPDKAAANGDIRYAAGLTHTGFYRVCDRLRERRLIANAARGYSTQITFGGLRAIGAV